MAVQIKCPQCGHNIEISDVLAHQVEEQVKQSVKESHAKELVDVANKAKEDAIREYERSYEQELKNAKKEAEEEKERSSKLLGQLEKLSDELRSLRRKDEERELEQKKLLMQKEELIRKETEDKLRDTHNLETAQLKKKLDDMQKALDEAKAKGSQSSQQLQGEVLELELEEKLKTAFVYDEVLAVGKGVQGADILQRVRNREGKVAGIIMWETKRAKWTPSWLAKLKEDGRKNDATITVLVCENLPDIVENFKLMEGVLVTSIPYCISLASILRLNLMYIAQAKSATVNKDEKLEMLYEYIQSDAFRHRFEAFSDGIKAMNEDLLSERRSIERIWKRRETQINRMQLNSARMFGELQGIVGAALPNIKSLELDPGE